MAWINCQTEIKPQEYKQAENRGGNYNGYSGCITDGLSEEALGYVNEAVSRTDENKYSIFDEETGLMPEQFDIFEDYNYQLDEFSLPGSNLILKRGEDGIFRSEDGNVQFERGRDGSWTVSYDSDGQNGVDRVATYKNIPGMGYKKVEESFDADGDGTNEVVLNKDYYMEENTETILYETENPDKKWWQKLFPWIEQDKITESYEKTTYSLHTTASIGVNADDLGYDEENGEHFEFTESATYTSTGTHPSELEPETCVYTQTDYFWESATGTKHDKEKRTEGYAHFDA